MHRLHHIPFRKSHTCINYLQNIISQHQRCLLIKFLLLPGESTARRMPPSVHPFLVTIFWFEWLVSVLVWRVVWWSHFHMPSGLPLRVLCPNFPIPQRKKWSRPSRSGTRTVSLHIPLKSSRGPWNNLPPYFFFLSPVAPVVALQSQLNLTRRPSLKVLL